VSESDRAQPTPEQPPQSWSETDVEALIRATGARPVESVEDLDRYTLDVWESDEEYEAFLAHIRAQRNAEVA
jgi:hypothetical protein